MANWRKTSTPNVYVAHQQRCAAFRDEHARCSCAPSWRGRRWNPVNHRSEWQKPVTKNRSEVLSWLGAGKKGAAHLRERASAGRTFEIFVARATPDGRLRPAGAAELGLSGQQRDELRTALRERHLEIRRGAHRVAAGIWVDVDFHGGPTGPLRDAVMRAVRIDP